MIAPLLLLWSVLHAFTPVSAAPSPQHPISSFGVPGDATFDYVIIGGGTAGLTIATKLASNPDLSVAVVEAGGFYEVDSKTSVVPLEWTFNVGTYPNDTNPAIDWGFNTVPQAVSSSLIWLRYSR